MSEFSAEFEHPPVRIESQEEMRTALSAYLSRMMSRIQDIHGELDQPLPTVPVKISGVDFNARIISISTSPHSGKVETVALLVDTDSPSGDAPKAVVLCRDDSDGVETKFNPVSDAIPFKDYWSIPNGTDLIELESQET